jgi:hypothetical protein
MLIFSALVAGLALAPQTARPAGGSLSQQTDTGFVAKQGDRLDIWNQSGSVVLRIGQGDRVRILANYARGVSVNITHSAPRFNVTTSGTLNGEDSVRFEITIPAWMPVTVQGSSTDISAEGALDDLTLKTQSGDVSVRGPAGSVVISAATGSVRVDGARRKVQISAGGKPVRVSRVAGILSVASVDNDILLDRIESIGVDARTISGKVSFDGVIAPNGRYHLSSQRGNVTATLPPTVNAFVTIATYVGRFVTDFPVKPPANTRQRFSLTVGGGSAQVNLEAFGGTVTMRKATPMKVTGL